MKQVQLTSRQAYTILALSIVGFGMFFLTHKSPVDQLEDNLTQVFVNHSNVRVDTDLLIVKIVSNAKDQQKCSTMFNTLFIPAVAEMNKNKVTTPRKNMEEAIEIVISGIRTACK